MSEVDLVNSNRFTLTVKTRVPSTEKPNTWRDFEFDATFEAMPSEEWEELVEECSKTEALRHVLVDVGENIKPATITQNGKQVELSPVDIVVRNQFTSDAAYMDYNLYITKNSRDKATQATSSKNSKRSRGR